uniref:Immunoglobulin V-set domain-containing protein n=1 Tax=Oryzias latipes TaxID=8090 RepID=A0A3P9LII6_ORYLA
MVHSFIFYCVLIPFGVTGCWSLSLPLAGKRREHPGQLTSLSQDHNHTHTHITPLDTLELSLDQDGLKRGDVTLKIRNVSLQDEGNYSCFIPGKNFRETVQLVVGEFALQVLPHMKNICPEQQAGNDVISLFQSQTESELQPWKHPRLTSSPLQIQEETGSGSD